VLRVAREHRADVIEGADHHGELAQVIRATGRPPVLVKIHGSNPINILQDSQVLYRWQKFTVKVAHLRNWQQTSAERFSIEHADMALVPSARMKEELSRQGLHLPDKNKVLPNPVIPFDGRLVPESSIPTVLMVARIDAGKGIQYLPGIVRNLTEKFPDLILEIAGDDSFARGIGSMKEWLINKLGRLAPHVRFQGRLNEDQRDVAYGRAWVVIIPSRWDNFPTVLLEAMARGKPVVASPHGGMPEMLEGTLCKTALPESEEFVNLTACLLEDASRRKAAGDSLRSRARLAYSPETIVGTYVDTLNTWGVGG
jgi:glycosyltransferase involved in cell wall biosynthesis